MSIVLPQTQLLNTTGRSRTTAATTDGLEPGTTLGVYEVLSAIGAGGIGEVYKARDTKLDRDVARVPSTGCVRPISP